MVIAGDTPIDVTASVMFVLWLDLTDLNHTVLSGDVQLITILSITMHEGGEGPDLYCQYT
jgi:hypothetical protein